MVKEIVEGESRVLIVDQRLEYTIEGKQGFIVLYDEDRLLHFYDADLNEHDFIELTDKELRDFKHMIENAATIDDVKSIKYRILTLMKYLGML